MKITIRTDSGFSCAPFYKLVDDYNLLFAIGISSNNVLKKHVAKKEKEIKKMYLSEGEKYQDFITFRYQVKSWHKE